jgi:S-phase kinase-associated protein 1
MADTVTLKTCDGARRDVSREVASRSRLLQSIMDPDSNVEIDDIPLAVTSASLDLVLGHLDRDVSTLEKGDLVSTILAANYLDVPDLLKRACHAVAASLRGKTTGEMRSYFGIANDLSAEEEAAVRRENFWPA